MGCSEPKIRIFSRESSRYPHSVVYRRKLGRSSLNMSREIVNACHNCMNNYMYLNPFPRQSIPSNAKQIIRSPNFTVRETVDRRLSHPMELNVVSCQRHIIAHNFNTSPHSLGCILKITTTLAFVRVNKDREEISPQTNAITTWEEHEKKLTFQQYARSIEIRLELISRKFGTKE
jgi:hypothetical protein